MILALRTHWPEYLSEALGLGVFMISAWLVTALFEYPASPVHAAMANADGRRLPIGVATGLTAIAIIYSPWGKRSGAHIKLAVTLTFRRLGRVAPWDALSYVLAQFAGGALGVALLLRTVSCRNEAPVCSLRRDGPGEAGVVGALVGEGVISLFLMFAVLIVNGSRFAACTGIAAGCLVASYIAVEAPYSGMGMNPARSAASSIVASEWRGWWLYFLAPPTAMLLAAEAYLRVARLGAGRVRQT